MRVYERTGSSPITNWIYTDADITKGLRRSRSDSEWFDGNDPEGVAFALPVAPLLCKRVSMDSEKLIVRLYIILAITFVSSIGFLIYWLRLRH